MITTKVNNNHIELTQPLVPLTVEPAASLSRNSQLHNMARLAELLSVQEKSINTLKRELKTLQEAPIPNSVVRVVTVGDIAINLEFLNGVAEINPTEAFALSVAFQNMLQVYLPMNKPALLSTEPVTPSDMYATLTEQEIEDLL